MFTSPQSTFLSLSLFICGQVFRRGLYYCCLLMLSALSLSFHLNISKKQNEGNCLSGSFCYCCAAVLLLLLLEGERLFTTPLGSMVNTDMMITIAFDADSIVPILYGRHKSTKHSSIRSSICAQNLCLFSDLFCFIFIPITIHAFHLVWNLSYSRMLWPFEN